MENDTYGEITREELADLRLHAQRCDVCGMLATVDPVLHASRYGHEPRVHHSSTAFRWDSGQRGWTQEA